MGPPPGASPPMRMTASWSGSNDPTAYESVARRYAHLASSPRILNRPTRTPNRTLMQSPVAVHRRSACSGVKARRNTSAARRQAAKLCYRFGPLTPSARSANPDRRRRDEEPAFPLRTKNPTTNQKQLLDRKSPIRVRILFPPATSQSVTISAAAAPCAAIGTTRQTVPSSVASCSVTLPSQRSRSAVRQRSMICLGGNRDVVSAD
jgi:hypothetical protein